MPFDSKASPTSIDTIGVHSLRFYSNFSSDTHSNTDVR